MAEGPNDPTNEKQKIIENTTDSNLESDSENIFESHSEEITRTRFEAIRGGQGHAYAGLMNLASGVADALTAEDHPTKERNHAILNSVMTRNAEYAEQSFADVYKNLADAYNDFCREYQKYKFWEDCATELTTELNSIDFKINLHSAELADINADIEAQKALLAKAQEEYTQQHASANYYNQKFSQANEQNIAAQEASWEAEQALNQANILTLRHSYGAGHEFAGAHFNKHVVFKGESGEYYLKLFNKEPIEITDPDRIAYIKEQEAKGMITGDQAQELAEDYESKLKTATITQMAQDNAALNKVNSDDLLAASQEKIESAQEQLDILVEKQTALLEKINKLKEQRVETLEKLEEAREHAEVHKQNAQDALERIEQYEQEIEALTKKYGQTMGDLDEAITTQKAYVDYLRMEHEALENGLYDDFHDYQIGVKSPQDFHKMFQAGGKYEALGEQFKLAFDEEEYQRRLLELGSDMNMDMTFLFENNQTADNSLRSSFAKATDPANTGPETDHQNTIEQTPVVIAKIEPPSGGMSGAA